MRRLLDVDLRLLQIFRTIAECQGLVGAELVLNLSQSRLSAGLAELEARLKVRLCRRGRSGFALTEAGKTVYEASQHLFKAVDRFCNEAAAVSANLKRVLRIGSVDAVVSNGDLALSRVLLQFRRQNPAVIIDFSTAGPEELERQLVEGKRDVVIMPSINKRADLHFVSILEERQSLYCARHHPLFDRSDHEITEADLSDCAFVARGYLHQYDLERIGHRGAEATVETMEAQLILILCGEFIGFLPAHYADAWVDSGQLRCLHDDAFSYNSTFYLVSSRAAGDNPLLGRFKTAILDRGASFGELRTDLSLRRL